MLPSGIAKKVTIHLNDDTSSAHDFLYNEIFSFLRTQGVAGATLIRPDAGFGSHHQVHQKDLADGGYGRMPVRIEFIESPDKVASLMPELCALLTDGLIEAHETVIYKSRTSEVT